MVLNHSRESRMRYPTRRNRQESRRLWASPDPAQIRTVLKPLDPAQVRAALPPLSIRDTDLRPYDVPPRQFRHTHDVEVEDDPPPSNADIEAMIEQLDATDMREALRDLARGIALSWGSGRPSAARRALGDWLATAEVLADSEALTTLLEAKESIERGEGTPWEELRENLGL